MESQPPNTEFRNNPENFHQCKTHLASLTFIGLPSSVNNLLGFLGGFLASL